MKEYIASETAIKWSTKKNPPLMDPWETDLLIKYIKECKIHFVEIGTHKGGAASLISKYLPENVKLTTIDIFEKAPKDSLPPPKPATYEEARQTIEKEGDISKVEIIKGISWNVAEEWKKKIDVLFIDGNHIYDAVIKDFNNWIPHVVRGGYILIHDTNFLGVKNALKEILQNPNFLLKEKSGTLVVIKNMSH